MTDPLDVAVEIDPIEHHKFALSLAARHGFEGSALDLFADRLMGSTRDEMELDANDFAETINAIREANAPKRVMATDSAQGLGVPRGRSDRDRFSDLIFEGALNAKR